MYSLKHWTTHWSQKALDFTKPGDLHCTAFLTMVVAEMLVGCRGQ